MEPAYYQYVDRVCKTCSSTFKVQYQSVLAGKGLYCSRKCNPVYKLNGKKKQKNPLGTTHTKVKRVCPTCSIEFVTKVKNINRGGGIYCSVKCSPNKLRLTPEQKRINVKEYNLKNAYGLTLGQYNKMLEGQNHSCAICGAKEGNARCKHLFVDHDHKTGKIRGLLCGPCNSAIGLLREKPLLLDNIKNYLS